MIPTDLAQDSPLGAEPNRGAAQEEMDAAHTPALPSQDSYRIDT